ncbi:DUF937 domain-containing protein [Spirosoma taeanense]|uniref:DUF937 domain-containing protein n=1 Tax=Spirosoma taeanense TaxID=2735870 RepID=A0A6M5Y7V9_9BACT|nr:DUF937 domain-containing protein [Spirosoma taeanense]QJW89486.1 DUF937 domain-containing protein [Spirosoma taeanense]
MTLFASFNEILNPDVLSRIAVYVDEPTEKTHKAVDGLVYTVVGGLMKRTTTEIGVNQLYNHIQKGRYDGSLTDNLATILRDPALTNTLITQGNDVISHLLPAMKSSIGTMISGYAGIRNSSAISLLGLTTTIVLHVLGKQVKERKLDADGLASSLFAEREAFVNAVPEEFMPRLVEKVGLQQVVSGMAAPARRAAVESPVRPVTYGGAPAGRSVATATRTAVSYEPDTLDNDNSSLAKWGVGALLALVVAAGGYYIYQNTRNYSGDAEEVNSETLISNDTAQADTVTRSLAVPVDMAAKTTPKTAAPASTTPGAANPAGAAAGALTQQLTPYLSNPALPKGRVFPLPGVSFLPGSLSLTPGSQATIGELTTLLKTHPSMQIQLIGYANDAQGGLTNKSLSFKRVYQIKQQLMSSGIDFVRIDAIGRGSGVSRRDTSGVPRPTLRKIDFKVVVK